MPARFRCSSSTDYLARILLGRSGLIPDRDVKILYAGAAGPVQAVASRIAASSFVSAPTTLQAKARGLKEILNIKELKIPFLFIRVLAPRKIARQKSEAISGFLRAYVEAISVFRRDKGVTVNPELFEYPDFFQPPQPRFPPSITAVVNGEAPT